MRNKASEIALTVLIFSIIAPVCLIFSGCAGLMSFPAESADEAYTEQMTVTPDVSGSTAEATDITGPTAEEDPSYEEATDMPPSCYVFSTLDENHRRIYLEIYNILNSMSSDKPLSTVDADLADMCFSYVMSDHPELFFVEGYRTTTYTLAGKVTSMSLTGKYTMDKSERQRRQALIDNYVNQCLSGVPENADEYTKTKYIFDYLVGHTDYSSSSADNQNICSVFIDCTGVCQAYASATKYLLDRLGILCAVVEGTANGESHAWNLVRMDGRFCYVDTTWGDSSYRIAGESSSCSFEDYSYLGADSDIIGRTHEDNGMITLPVCNSLDNYYFVREGKYFESADMDKMRSLVDEAYEKGDTSLTVSCADHDVYEALKTELFDNDMIFDMLHTGGRADYVTRDSEFTISISLQL